MSSSPQQEYLEKVRSVAAKKIEAASEALLKARETGEGPVFSDDQNTNLAAVCKQKGVDAAEFLTRSYHLCQVCIPPQSNWPKTGGLF